MSGMDVQTVALADLVPDSDNARTHDAANLTAISRSLEQFGQVEPLVVQRGTNRVIGGNGRLQAMQALGLTEAGVVYVDVDDQRAKALGLALNRSGELAAWDEDRLGTLLAELNAEDWFDPASYAWDPVTTPAAGGDPATDPAPAGDGGGGAPSTDPVLGDLEYRVVVECRDEQHQADVLAQMENLGLICRPLIS